MVDPISVERKNGLLAVTAVGAPGEPSALLEAVTSTLFLGTPTRSVTCMHIQGTDTESK